jgi:glycosyltransferase involved in cell wall biosynthesis
VSLKPERKSKGNVLLSYILKPFLLKPEEHLPNAHMHYWRSLQIAKTFLDLGYAVDVIDYRNDTFIPGKDYKFFIDVRHNLQRLAPLLNKDCIKIHHIDTAHIIFHNFAECRRLLYLQQRRGVTLRNRRFEMPNLAIEHADYATVAANKFTIDTFKYANKLIYLVPQSPCVLYPWADDKNYEFCRRTFLWFNSGGLVHKGLDLVLEAFAEMPDYHLYVCGPVRDEKDFESVYYKELYDLPNIHTVGWVDISSSEFIDIANKCIGVVCASCSEGGGGSVIVCMHAGLIPIISYETSVDVDESYGVILYDCSITAIRKAIEEISQLPAEKLREMSKKAWDYVRHNHTQERFADEYKKVILDIIARDYKRC